MGDVTEAHADVPSAIVQWTIARLVEGSGAEDLREAFPDMKGFSPRNLEYMRAFAAAWPQRAIVQQVAAQIPWFHSCLLLDRVRHALMNTGNCVGVMGKGVAQEFKKRFPAMFADYQARCARKHVRLGEPYLYRDASGLAIINFPTKDHWRSPSRLADIERGLDYFAEHILSWGLTTVAMPPAGVWQWWSRRGRGGPVDLPQAACAARRHRGLRPLRHAEGGTGARAWEPAARRTAEVAISRPLN